MRIVVAEKPSVARDLARVLGATQRRDGYLEGSGLRVTWCFGHMVELEEPAHYDPVWKRWSLDLLPMVPTPFALRVRKGAAEQFAVLRRLMRDSATVDVVNACDAGREGELIFRYVASLAGCTKPVLRLWASSLTDSAIRRAWTSLSPSAAYDRLGAAARCRAEADWLVGLNATRALTCRARDAGGDGLLSVGRVQTPTLAMIIARDREIDAFVPDPYHLVRVTFSAEPSEEPGPRSFKALWFDPDPALDQHKNPSPDKEGDDAQPAERLKDRAAAERIGELVDGRNGQVVQAERKRTRERPPLLYDLTSLQQRANQRYGMSAQRTLEVAQALYEKHKLITYPRTDSRYLTPDDAQKLPEALRGLLPIGPYTPFVAGLLAQPLKLGPRIVNASEVGDHPAILPTGNIPSGALPADEKRVFDLIARRLLAALSDDAEFDQTKLRVEVPASVLLGALPEGIVAPLCFRASGRICRVQGWRAVDPPGRSAEIDLPAVVTGELVLATEPEVLDHQTRPPRRYNDGTLLRSMERAGAALDDEALARALRGSGLGTPATRASILQTLLDRAYIVRQGRDLVGTDRGRALIDAVPIDELKNAELTARWEGRLSEMADGRASGENPLAPESDSALGREAFMDDVVRHTHEIVAALAQSAPRIAPSEAKALGTCPGCGRPVRARGPVFTCDSGRECGFVVFAVTAKRKIGVRAVTQLLQKGSTATITGFRSKAGRDFSAALAWDSEAGKVVMRFDDGIASPSASKSTPQALPEAGGVVAVGDVCPACGSGRIVSGRTMLGCDRWREGCGYRTQPAEPATGVPGAQADSFSNQTPPKAATPKKRIPSGRRGARRGGASEEHS